MKKAFLQLHLSVLLAGWTGIFGKLITMSPGFIVLWRIIIAGTCSGDGSPCGARLNMCVPKTVSALWLSVRC